MRRGLRGAVGLLALGLGALGLTGCAHPQTAAAKLEALNEAVEAYNHAYRWKSYGQASAFLPPDLREPFLSAYEDEEASLQIEEYRVLRVSVSSEDSAKVSVKVRYMMLPSVIVQTVTLVQHWQLVAGSWTLETEENSIRPLEPGTKPRATTTTLEVPPEADGDTELEVTTPIAEPITAPSPD